jgi:hypothetical protein
VHKETLKVVANSKEGRDSVELSIHGMKGVPPEVLYPLVSSLSGPFLLSVRCSVLSASLLLCSLSSAAGIVWFVNSRRERKGKRNRKKECAYVYVCVCVKVRVREIESVRERE